MGSLLMGGTMAATRESKPACVIANEWVANHLTELPQTYSEFVKLPASYRAAMYSHLSVGVRQSLWRSHLEEYLNASGGLTDEQREFTRGVIARLPIYIDAQAGSGAFKGAETMRKARRLFGDSLSNAIFLNLVPDSQRESEAFGTAMLPDCDCNRNADCSGRHCNYMAQCDPVPMCNSEMSYACTGQCSGDAQI
jgi:hypothetical protein